MSRKLVIIKLGGSVITDKSKSKGVFRKKDVQRLALEISQVKKKQDFDLIIVHGAGSFGHPIAKKYNLHKGYLGPKSSEGFALTKQAMLELGFLVWRELARAGINACVVIHSVVIKTSGRRISKFDTEFIEDLIRKRIAPVLFGDAVFDEKDGFSIVSGDVMVAYLSKKLKAAKVVYISNVDGVFDRNPKTNRSAKLIPVINSKNYKEIVGAIEMNNKNDTSGEMRGKLEAIKQELSGKEVQIINGLRGLRLKEALSDEATPSTTILL